MLAKRNVGRTVILHHLFSKNNLGILYEDFEFTPILQWVSYRYCRTVLNVIIFSEPFSTNHVLDTTDNNWHNIFYFLLPIMEGHAHLRN